MSLTMAFWDIECTDLDSRWARILTCAVKPYREETNVLVNPNLRFSRGKRSLDREMLRMIRKELEKYDVLVGYYSGRKRFDLPMVNSRLLSYDERILAPRFHIDLYPVVKTCLRLNRNRLECAGEILHIPGKTHINPDDWVEAAWDGSKTAIANIVDHNKYDVIVLEGIWEKLKDFVTIIRRM